MVYDTKYFLSFYIISPIYIYIFAFDDPDMIKYDTRPND